MHSVWQISRESWGASGPVGVRKVGNDCLTPRAVCLSNSITKHPR